MNQRIRHGTLNPGRMAGQRLDALHPETRQGLRPRGAGRLNRKPAERMTCLGVPRPFSLCALTWRADVYGPLLLGRWSGGNGRGVFRAASPLGGHVRQLYVLVAKASNRSLFGANCVRDFGTRCGR